MSRNAWLTPDTPPAQLMCRSLFFPANLNWLAIVAGCLDLLTDPANFEQFGTATPDECAAVFFTMLDGFSLPPERVCKLVGEIVTWPTLTNPSVGYWLACDGSHVSNVDYPDLYTVIGTLYGGTGPTDFALPDLRDNVDVGAGGAYPVGSTGGEATHTLIGAEMPTHSHIDLGHSHAEGNALPTAITIGAGVPAPSAIPAVSVTGVSSANIQNAGGGGAHNNIQPYIALGHFIVAR